MSGKDNVIGSKPPIGIISTVVIGTVSCFLLFSARSRIAGLFIPQESDFPGLSEALIALGETPHFISASWVGNPLNEVEINGITPGMTQVGELRRIQCPTLLEIADQFVSDDFDVEVHVRSSVRIPCN